MRYLLLTVLLALPALASAAPKIEHWVTGNGARAYFIETHALPIVDVSLVFNAAAARDPVSRQGLAMLTSDMLLEGSGSLDSKAVAEGFEARGAEIATSSLRDMAIVSLRTLSDSEYLGPVSDLLATVISRPTFPQDSLDREKARSLQSLDYALQQPRTLAKRKLYESLYAGHPYANHPEGTHETLKSIKREDLIAFYLQHYVARNMVIAIVGDLDLDEARKLSEKISGKLPEGKKAMPLPPVPPSGSAMQRIEFPSSQSHIMSGYQGISRDNPLYLALKVANYSLGGGSFQSRLMDELRDKRGLTYGAYSYFLPMQQTGPFIAGLSTRNDQVDDALKVNNRVIDEYLKSGPTDKEVDMAKKNITGGFPLTIDSNKKLVSTLASIGFYSLPLDYLDTYIERVNALDRDKVTKALQSALSPADRVTVIVGNGKE